MILLSAVLMGSSLLVLACLIVWVWVDFTKLEQ